MSLGKILEGIDKAPLTEDVKDAAKSEARKNWGSIGGLFDSLNFKPPQAHEEWHREIVCEVMKIISPILLTGRVAPIDGTNTYAHIYASIRDEDPEQYLE